MELFSLPSHLHTTHPVLSIFMHSFWQDFSKGGHPFAFPEIPLALPVPEEITELEPEHLHTTHPWLSIFRHSLLHEFGNSEHPLLLPEVPLFAPEVPPFEDDATPVKANPCVPDKIRNIFISKFGK